jgi:response regulator RpfG family c-di-GMP phosphodiesterase
MQKKDIRVLYVDDEVSNLTGFKANFRRYYTVFTASSAKEAEEILAANEIHVLITDQKMPETAGTQLLESAIIKYPEQTRILLTAYADNEAIIDAFQKGLMYRYILKPYKPDELKEVIDLSYEIYSLKRIKEALYKEWVKTQEEISLLKKKSG